MELIAKFKRDITFLSHPVMSGVVQCVANSTGAVMRKRTGHCTIDHRPQLARQWN